MPGALSQGDPPLLLVYDRSHAWIGAVLTWIPEPVEGPVRAFWDPFPGPVSVAPIYRGEERYFFGGSGAR
jgi:hypothetical protein